MHACRLWRRLFCSATLKTVRFGLVAGLGGSYLERASAPALATIVLLRRASVGFTLYEPNKRSRASTSGDFTQICPSYLQHRTTEQEPEVYLLP